MRWVAKHPSLTTETLGFLPGMLNDESPLSARDQFDLNYKHGGGWQPFQGFTMLRNGIKYPGDPVVPLLAETVLHAHDSRCKPEIIRFYQHSWVAIVQLDGSYEIARMD